MGLEPLDPSIYLIFDKNKKSKTNWKTKKSEKICTRTLSYDTRGRPKAVPVMEKSKSNIAKIDKMSGPGPKHAHPGYIY